jgi:hypothetical protein
LRVGAKRIESGTPFFGASPSASGWQSASRRCCAAAFCASLAAQSEKRFLSLAASTLASAAGFQDLTQPRSVSMSACGWVAAGSPLASQSTQRDSASSSALASARKSSAAPFCESAQAG